MTTRRPYTRHGRTASMVRVKLEGFTAVDRRMVAARELLAFKRELVAALGGEDTLSPQRRRLVDLAARAALIVDHVDAWLFAQRSLVNARSRAVLPILVQRTQLAEHLARLLDKLGLERIPAKIPTLAEYLSGRNGQNASPASAPGPTRATRGYAVDAVDAESPAVSEAETEGETTSADRTSESEEGA